MADESRSAGTTGDQVTAMVLASVL